MSEGALRVLGAALALAGLAISLYLTITWYDDSIPVCVGGGGGCEKVQTSDYADWAGVPVALVGAIGYALILISLALPGDTGRFSGVLFGLVGVGFSVYLTYLELFVIDAICQWCVASAVVMTALAAVLLARFLKAPDQ
ncbi:MAG: vitamin K epoxide reductase family protein [Actinobacteria bacterium]|nr:vitamin K epoxide reductase family protein [Actinomycetota bacterium]